MAPQPDDMAGSVGAIMWMDRAFSHTPTARREMRMRIAVVSIDGTSVAPALSGARYLLVFPVTDEEVSSPAARPLTDEALPVAANSLMPKPSGDLVSFPAPAFTPDSPGTGIPEALKLALLDCDLLLAGAFSLQQLLECRHLGILALPVPTSQDAEHTVRLVVSGTGPHAGTDCGDCPTA